MENYETSDIILAAVLRLKGYTLDGIKCVGNKGTFTFVGVDPQFITEYDLGQTLVEPITFNNAIKQLTTSVRRMVNGNY